jgi:hypothetical protein
MRAEPPRIATWLAERFLTKRQRESLVGDLIEQYGEGRSVAWYWGQVLGAIVASTTEELVGHKVMALRALALGLGLYFLFSFPVSWMSATAQGWIGSALVSCGPAAFWCQFWSNQFSAELLVYAACALSGWIIARLHREHAIPAVCLFSAAVLVLEYGMIACLLAANPPPPGVPRTTVVLVSILSVLGRPVAVLFGGLSGVQNQSAGFAVPLD